MMLIHRYVRWRTNLVAGYEWYARFVGAQRINPLVHIIMAHYTSGAQPTFDRRNLGGAKTVITLARSKPDAVNEIIICEIFFVNYYCARTPITGYSCRQMYPHHVPCAKECRKLRYVSESGANLDPGHTPRDCEGNTVRAQPESILPNSNTIGYHTALTRTQLDTTRR